MQSQTIARSGATTVTQQYAYDGLNRLTIAAANPSQPVANITSCSTISGGGTQWCQRNGYDRWGNRWAYTSEQFGSLLPQVTNEVPTGSGSFSNNRITGFTYDAAGNVTNSAAVRTSTYDAENRQTTVIPSNGERTDYAYDGEGRRIKKTVGVGSANPTTTVFVYDASGQLAAEYGGPAPVDTGTRYLFGDHLGSTRLISKADGSVDKTYDYLPFGEELGGFYPGSTEVRGSQPAKFTGHLRDAETGLDFMLARYYAGAQGRFTSPDVPFADQKTDDPQSWNLYAYVRNNPTRNVDPSGRACFDGSGASSCVDYLIGGAKELYNTPYHVINLPNAVVDYGLSFFTDYRLGPAVNLPFSPSNTSQAQGMDGMQKALLVSPLAEVAVGESVSAARGLFSKGATVTRYMGPGEAAAAKNSRLIPNTNADGEFRPTHVTTDRPVNSGAVAQQVYELPSAPTHRATVPASRVKDLQVAPDGRRTTSGGGSQAATHQPIPVKKREIRPLEP